MRSLDFQLCHSWVQESNLSGYSATVKCPVLRPLGCVINPVASIQRASLWNVPQDPLRSVYSCTHIQPWWHIVQWRPLYQGQCSLAAQTCHYGCMLLLEKAVSWAGSGLLRSTSSVSPTAQRRDCLNLALCLVLSYVQMADDKSRDDVLLGQAFGHLRLQF